MYRIPLSTVMPPSTREFQPNRKSLLDSFCALPLHRRMRRNADAKSAERAAREERLAKALRDNLRRRKEQAQDRRAAARQEESTKKSQGEHEPTA